MRLATADQMRGLDAAAITEFGVPGIVLMENAGKTTVDIMARRFGSLAGRQIAILVGPGNNGGDGLVMARHIHQRGGLPKVFLLVKPETIKGDAATNLAIVQKLPVAITLVLDEETLSRAEAEISEAFVLVDAIFGTGLKREVRGLFGSVVKMVNRLPQPVVAVDIPSGLDADSGIFLGECIRADLTVTYGLAKPGQVIHPGIEAVGDLEVVDIGIPPETHAIIGLHLSRLEKDNVVSLLPSRPVAGHKGTFGHLLVLAGSVGKTGAALLTAEGALRSGVGLVTLGVPKNLNPIFETSLLEAMSVPLEDSGNGCLSIADLGIIQAQLEGKKAVALGPGIGTEPETAELVAVLYKEIKLPMVVDADGLNILADQAVLLQQAGGPRVLTPHPGEMARLLGISVKEVQARRIPVAQDFARIIGAVVVLKGAATIVADPDGRVAVNSTGNGGMAVGGMGDVLTGIIGGFIAQGLGVFEAACLGVWAHGKAGDRLQEIDGIECGFLASELAGEIPAVLAEMRK